MITDREAMEAAQAASLIAPSGETSWTFLLVFAGKIGERARLDEREECAKLADSLSIHKELSGEDVGDAIRARGQIVKPCPACGGSGKEGK